MKKIFFILFPLLFMFASCDLDKIITSDIKSVEFYNDSYKTLCVSYTLAPGNPNVKIAVYPDYENNYLHVDGSYSIDSQIYTITSKKNIVKLNKEIPIGSKVVVTPAIDNDELYGEVTLYRR